jgi:CelD/BcsL family acetyltransferase involved in cellulose biosynthesis
MRIVCVTRREELDALAGAWDDLARRDPRDGFFRTFVWYRAWMEHIRPAAQPFVLLARDEHGALVGLAPLCRLRYADLGWRLNAIAWAGREVVSGDFLDVVTTPAARAGVLPAMLDFLCARRRDWSLLVLGELVEQGDSDHAVQSLAARYGLPLRRQEERVCPFITLPGTFDEYLAGLGSSTRYHIRRRMRDVARRGAEVCTFSDPEDVAGRLATLVRLHALRWRRDRQPGTLGRPGFAAFLRDVITHLPDGAACRLYELHHGGATVASLLTFRFGQSVLYYQAGWDPDSPVASVSPGVTLMASSIRDAAEDGFRYYEFLRGDEAYKSRWTTSCRTTATVLVAGNAVARGYLLVAALKDAVKPYLRARHRTSTVPEPSVEAGRPVGGSAGPIASGSGLISAGRIGRES